MLREERQTGKTEEEGEKQLESNLPKKTGKVEIFGQEHEGSAVKPPEHRSENQQNLCSRAWKRANVLRLSSPSDLFQRRRSAACYAE